MTHDRCSELLGGYVRGELSPEDTRFVREHLAGCEDCRAEERSAGALATGAEVNALTDLERARLHRGLAQELFKPRANADVAGAGSNRWTRWVAPAVAAAAVLAAIVVMTTGGGSDDEVAQEFGAPALEAEPSVADDAAGGGGGAASGGETRGSRALSADAGQESFDLTGGNPRPAFYPDFGVLTPGALEEIGDFRMFAGSYSPSDGPELYGPFLDRIEKEAVGIGPEIEECAATLPQDGSIIPVYGVVGEYDDRDALALGFVTNDPGSKMLDRYLVWVWAREDCSQPIDTFFEKIDAR